MNENQQPIIIMREGTERETGKTAQRKNIMAAELVADVVKSTLGPKGMDKMLVDSMGDITVTNDGATILKDIDIDHPAAKMMIEVAKSQDKECGDGTTSAVILTGELLKRAETLLDQGIHPTIIAKGFKMALNEIREHAEDLSTNVTELDKGTLRNIAKTSMASKNASIETNILSDIVVEAVTSVVEKIDEEIKVNLDNIQIQKVHGQSISKSELINGLVIDKTKQHIDMPDIVKDARIAIINDEFDVKKTNVEAKIEIANPTELQDYLDKEEEMIRDMVGYVVDSGANVVLCQKGIDDLATHYFNKEGIFTVGRVNKKDIQRISKNTQGKIISRISEITGEDLGTAGMIEQKKIGDVEMIFITDCPESSAVSIILTGSTIHIVDELERGLHDALFVVKNALEDGKILPGGGAKFIYNAMMLRDFKLSISGREQLAIEEFANALEIIPKTLAENGGLDPIDIIMNLRKSQNKGDNTFGIDINDGKVKDMYQENIIEPIRVSNNAIEVATEAAIMILKIDDVIASKKMEMPQGGGQPPSPY